ncbi:MAG: DUF1998 domain-containing protein [Myxococcales bacterium]|nr:DUF1998 domain-containing protein [Myxococcales bacterium]MCB9583636.1 DUF1998 domain-containing protein [Polyangiaceae bacterium]
MKPRRARRGAGPRPDGAVRLSQVVTTYGPGAMLDLVDAAVLVSGLDYWSRGHEAKAVDEPRLRDVLARRLAQAGRTLRREQPFLLPPAGDDSDPSKSVGIQVLEFPKWFVCQNPRCRRLVRATGLELKRNRYVHRCDVGGPSECVPVRFVGACPHGHLEDWPWIRFAHGQNPTCEAPQLTLHEGASGDFSEIVVRCACGGYRRLRDALTRETNPLCSGERPWLGTEGSEACSSGERLRLLVRTASNAYFSQVESALSIPSGETEALMDRVLSVWDVLNKVSSADEIAMLRKLVDRAGEALSGFDNDAVLQAVRAEKAGVPIERDPLRTAEYKELIRQPAERKGELAPDGADFFARSVTPKGGLPAGIARLVLASKLREVRVQVGFTRIDFPTPDLQGEYELALRTAPLGMNADWLPASEVRGEGIFIELDEQAVRAWERRAAVKERGRELLAGFDEQFKAAPPEARPDFPGVRFYLLHSLAHLLMSALSLECGYAASAIRERIYCAPADDEPPMAGILLSTGTPGTEGTLGGLVEQGRHLRHHLARALELGSLCSNDPVCAAHSPKGDLAERYLEGSACHGCLFIAECSCERFNRYLDRGLVVPTIGRDPSLAYFEV